MIHEDPATARGGELATIVVQVIKGFNVIDKLPRLLAAQDGCWETKCMKGDVILAHELRVGDVVGTFVGAPPAFPITAFSGVDPFLAARDVFDGCVKPDIENLAFHAGPILIALLDGHAPIEVAGDAAVLQAITVVQPFLCN